MITAVFFALAYYLAVRFVPGVRLENGELNAAILLPLVGIAAGLLDGLIALITSRKLLALILSPVVYVVISVAAWFLAKLTPWTRDAAGAPTDWGFITVAVILTIGVSSAFTKR